MTRPTSSPPESTDATRSSPATAPDGGSTDVLVAAGLVLASAVAALLAPDGLLLRTAVALPVLLVAPGYLLLQAVFVPAKPIRGRLVHAVLALGVSPPLLGLLALSTAIVPGGFTETAIVSVVTVACLGLAGVALLRRRRHRSPRSTSGAASATTTS